MDLNIIYSFCNYFSNKKSILLYYIIIILLNLVMFSMRESNYYITNFCYNCSFYYSLNKSSTFYKEITEEKPKGFLFHFYARESFYFYDVNNKQKKEANDMLLFLPEFKDKKNILTIGIGLPNNYCNNCQDSFIQQLKHKNIINQYFWTIIFKDDNKSNEEYDGDFIFGDILNDYYPYDKNYSLNKIFYTYTRNKKKQNNNNILIWGLSFDSVYYVLHDTNSNLDDLNKKDKIVNIANLISEFELNINTIFGTYEYSLSIKRDYFNSYFIRNICHLTYMKGTIFKYIYCYANNFTENDIKKFPPLYFKNFDLNYIFSLDYNDLFYLTQDNQYYIFNIMLTDLYIMDRLDEDELDGTKWVFGLPFLKKYQFSFDSDNKLIYFFNKKGLFLKDIIPEEDEVKNKYEKNNNELNKTNEIKNKNNKFYSIEINRIFVFIALFVLFISLFFVLVLIIKKILFKKGFVLLRAKKANELIENEYYDYSCKKIDFKKDKSAENSEVEMIIQNYN